MTYRKVFKWILVGLFIAGLITSAYGFLAGWPGTDEWKGDLDKAAELKEVIGTMESNGVETLEGEALEARKKEIQTLNETRTATIKTHNEAVKAKDGLKKNSKEFKAKEAEIAELKNAEQELQIKIYELEEAVTLAGHKADLAEVEAKIANSEKPVNVIIVATYIMIIIVLVTLLIAFIVNWISNPWALLKFGLVLLGAGLLVFAAYAIAKTPDQATVASYGIEGLTAGKVEMTDALLYLTYFMFGATLVVLVASWIAKAVRK